MFAAGAARMLHGDSFNNLGDKMLGLNAGADRRRA
jgi:hypothetical protein